MRIIFLIILSFISIKVCAPPLIPTAIIIKPEPLKDKYEEIWNAVCFVESTNNPKAVNFEKNGYSIGIVQIRQIRVSDYNNRTGKSYTLKDCFDPDISKEIFMYYAHKIQDEERIIRRWNGSGPKTIEYYNKVIANM